MNALNLPGRPRLASLLVAAFLALGATVPAQTILAVKVKKERNEYAVWFDKLSFTIKMTAPGTTPPPPPTFTIDLYDEDDAGGDEGRDVDLTETSATVKVLPWKFLGPAGPGSRWECFVSTGGVIENDVTDLLPGDYPDPRVEIVVTVGSAPPVSSDVAAPDLPAVGAADFGVTGPSALANSLLLDGEPIASLSRGFDDISRLPDPRFPTRLEQAALYFACQHDAVVPGSDAGSGPGRMFVLDAAGDLWPEDLYAANFDPDEAMLATPRYLNVNTAAQGGQVPTDEIYFVREGSAEVLYSSTGDPSAATLYLDVAAPQGVTALAVEDMAPRGVWGPGDRVLYALSGSAAIHSWTYGSAPVFLSLPGGTFDGSTQIGFDHFERDLSQHSTLEVGNILALSVSSPTGATPEPSDRMETEVVDHNGLFTYGPADGGHIGFRNNPVLGTPDFEVTLRDAGQGMWAMLYMGTPDSGVALPPELTGSMLFLDPGSLVPVYSPSETTGGEAARTLPIPTAPALDGAELGFQWIVFLPSVLPVTLSDAGVVYLRQ